MWASARHACNCATRHTSLTSGKTNLIIITVDFIHAALNLVSFLRVCRLFMQQRGIIPLRWKMEVREMEHLVKIIKVTSAQYLPSERPYCNQYIHHRSHGPLQWQRTEIACRIEYFPMDWKKQAPVVQKVDNAIHRINHYPLDIAIGFAITYPVDSDLSGG